ncbi:MAG: energy-coupling factor ABC transporter permease [Microcella sp.]|uniref:energy-coupling factor ABC transporter permease n=1 Tax=Microcella sp. TaxID=1913979 RepID=UPI00331592FA
MHVPDGFLDVPTSIATGTMAAGFLALASYRARDELSMRGPALPGLTAAFIFAGQMVNFPVGVGTSGHLIGAALAAALVGPWIGTLVMSVVVIVQALVFADGGITALGTNLLLLAIIPVFVAYGVQRLVLRLARYRRPAVVPAAALAAFVSVPVSAFVFTGLYLLGGAIELPVGGLLASMVGWHLIIGIGEAVITAAVLGAVLAARPDLVRIARPLTAEESSQAAESPTRASNRSIVTVGLALSLIVGGGVSLLASANPDGLEYVAESLGFLDTAEESVAVASPLADYALFGESVIGASLAGVIGVVFTFAVTLAIAFALRSLSTRASSTV